MEWHIKTRVTDKRVRLKGENKKKVYMDSKWGNTE